MKQGKIREINGDVTNPQLNENEIAVIPHCCNNLRVMGGGVAYAIRQKWPYAYMVYNLSEQELGSVTFAPHIENDNIKIVIANMIGQDGLIGQNNSKPVKYWALSKAMLSVQNFCNEMQGDNPDKEIVIHSPKFGSDLAGGRWDIILELINEIWVEKGIEVVIYNFEK